MRVTELDLSPVALASLEAAGITNVEQLTKRPADDLLPQTAHIGPMELYEIVCQLNKHGYSLPGTPGGLIKKPNRVHREMLRLRLIEGLPLAEVGQRTGVTLERVRQLLKVYFGLKKTTPPTVKARRQLRKQRKGK